MPTRLAIEQEMLRILGQRDPEVALVPIPFYGTIASDGTGITAPILDRGTINANRYDGRYIKVVDDNTAVAYNPAVTVTGAHTAAITTLTVSSTTDIAVGHVIEVNSSEKMLVLAVPSSTTLTVSRGYQGTTAAALSGTETVRYDPFGFVTVVNDAALGSGGSLLVSPDFASSTGSAIASVPGHGIFQMYPKGFNPDILVDAINRVLENTEAYFMWPLTEFFADNDMEETGTSSYSSSNATLAKASGSWNGSQMLNVTASAAAGYAAATLGVLENEQFMFAAMGRVTSGDTGRLRLWDATAGAELAVSEDFTNSSAWLEFKFGPIVVADNTASLELRMMSVNNTDVSHWDDIQAWILGSYNYPMPSWLTRPEQIVDIVEFVGSPSGPNNDDEAFLPWRSYSRPLQWSWQYRDPRLDPYAWVNVVAGTNRPYVIAKRPFSTLGGDSSTTLAHLYYVAQKAVANILKNRGEAEWKVWARQAKRTAERLKYGGRTARSQYLTTEG